MTNQTLANTVIRILRQPGLAKIGFTLNGLSVTGHGYGLVAKAIEEKKIECRVVDKFESQGSAELAAGSTVEARYNVDANAMLLPREDYGSVNHLEEASVVHEATHAIFDLAATSCNTRTLAIDDESAAIFAQALYLKLCEKNQGNFTMMEPQDEAMKLVRNLMAETNNFQTYTRPYVLDPIEIQWLRNAVAKAWNFTKTEENGVPYDRSGAQYIYNGVAKCRKKAAKR